jgi:hypothetical protein
MRAAISEAQRLLVDDDHAAHFFHALIVSQSYGESVPRSITSTTALFAAT